MVSHLKHKCLLTMHSILEGNQDIYSINRMSRALSMDVLKENLLSIYLSYIEYYGIDYYDKQIFKHYEKNSKYNFMSFNNV